MKLSIWLLRAPSLVAVNNPIEHGDDWFLLSAQVTYEHKEAWLAVVCARNLLVEDCALQRTIGIRGFRTQTFEEACLRRLPYAHIFSRPLDLVLKFAVRHADSIS